MKAQRSSSTLPPPPHAAHSLCSSAEFCLSCQAFHFRRWACLKRTIQSPQNFRAGLLTPLGSAIHIADSTFHRFPARPCRRGRLRLLRRSFFPELVEGYVSSEYEDVVIEEGYFVRRCWSEKQETGGFFGDGGFDSHI